MVYDICLGSERVGQASVQHQGLYYKICCQCRLSGEIRFHVRAVGTNGEEDLGLLVPEGKLFCLHTAVAVKKLGEGLRFCLTPRHPERAGLFVPLKPDEPFSYLDCLRQAVLIYRGNQPGVVLQRDSSKPTGQ